MRVLFISGMLTALLIRSAAAQTLSRWEQFEPLAKALGKQSAEQTPNPKAVKAMEIVLSELFDLLKTSPGISNQQIEAKLKPYRLAAAQSGGEFQTQFSSLSFSIARRSRYAVISVNYGAASRLAIYDLQSKRRLTTPTKLEWQAPWRMEPILFNDGGLLVIGYRVQDASIRTAFRVHFMKLSLSSGTLVRSEQRMYNLDFGGVTVSGNRVKFVSIDEPKSFYTTMPDHPFERVENYAVTKGTPKLVSLKLNNPALRELDAWMADARTARRPDRLQARLRSFLPKTPMLDSYKIKTVGNNVQIDLGLDNHLYRFTLDKPALKYRVLSISRME